MKKIFLFSFLAALFMVSFTNDAHAQRKGKKKKGSKTDQYFDESGSIKHRLWYGSSAILGFSGANNFSFTQIGLTPMVGYKITENISVGPRFSLIYNGYKGFAQPVQEIGGEYFATANPETSVTRQRNLDFGIGLFARGKVFRSFFAHAEIENITNKTPVVFNLGGGNYYLLRSDDTQEIIVETDRATNAYLGVGYSSSAGLFGYEIVALYNLLIPENSFASPITIRVGFNYNF